MRTDGATVGRHPESDLETETAQPDLDRGLAQEICTMIAGELDATISIMGAEGVIVACSEPARIGDRHAVAARVMAGEADRLAVTAEVAERDPLMREGAVAAIDHAGRRVGVLGVAGSVDPAGRFCALGRHLVLGQLAARDAESRRIAEIHRESARAIAEREARLEDAFATMPDGICMFDAELRIEIYNERFLELWDLDRARMAAVSDLPALMALLGARGDLAGGDREAQVAEHDSAVRSSIDFVDEYRLDNGRIVELRGSPRASGGYVIAYRDVTSQRRNELALLAAKDEAENTLKNLRETQQDLVRAEKLASLGMLVTGVAHEINTPIGIALTAATDLRDQIGALDATVRAGVLKRSDLEGFLKRSAEGVDLTVSNCDRAGELIQSFKQVAVDQTTDERRRFDLRSYMEELLAGIRPRFAERELTLTGRCPGGIVLDSYPGPFAQVLSNLVLNALIHGYPIEEHRRGGTVRVLARWATDGVVEVSVSDDGRGIPPNQLELVFDPFFTTRRGSGNTGLGLHIVHNIVHERLGGTISLESESGSGTTVLLRLPVTVDAPPPAARAG